MNTLNLAFRNLLRNRRRSVTTFMAMVIGARCHLVVWWLHPRYEVRTGDGLRARQWSHSNPAERLFLYGSGNPAAYGIKEYEKILSLVRGDPELKPMLAVATPILQLGGIAGNSQAGLSRTVYGVGIVVEDRNKMRQWNDYQIPLRPSSVALTGTGADTAVIGEGVARVLQLCALLKDKGCSARQAEQSAAGVELPADVAELALSQDTRGAGAAGRLNTIEVLAANTHGAPSVARLNVVKAENQGIKELDDIYVAMHLAQAQRLIYASDEAPQVTAVVLQLKRTADIAAATARLDHLMATTFKEMTLEQVDFRTLNPTYVQVTGMFDVIFAFISMLIGSIVLFTVSNTMSMAVVERTGEIGTLRAMGVKRRGIRRLFVSEGLLLGLLGSALGVAVALAIAFAINSAGFTWLPPGQVEVTPLTVRVWGENGMLLSAAIGLTWWQLCRLGGRRGAQRACW